jgi:hypothetical protein
MSTLRTRPPQPVSGTLRWVKHIEPDNTSGVLYINGTCYGIHRLEKNHRTIGYRLMKTDGTVYEIDCDWDVWECTCPDFAYRRYGADHKGCKHVAALQASIRRGITP